MPEPSPGSDPVSGDHPGRSGGVLYIEDNPANMALVQRLLARREGIVVLSACDAQSGLALAQHHLPDVILMDVNLPDMSGLEALGHLQGNPATAGIPVIALSSDAFPAHIAQGMAAGFFRYITKPFKVEDLNTAIESALAEHRACSAPAQQARAPADRNPAVRP